MSARARRAALRGIVALLGLAHQAGAQGHPRPWYVYLRALTLSVCCRGSPALGRGVAQAFLDPATAL